MCSYSDTMFQNWLNTDLLFDTQLSTSTLTTLCVCPAQKRFEEDLKRIWTRAGLKKAPEGWTTPKIFIKRHGNKDWETLDFVSHPAHNGRLCSHHTKVEHVSQRVQWFFWQHVHNLIKIFLCWTQAMVCCFFLSIIWTTYISPVHTVDGSIVQSKMMSSSWNYHCP